MASPDGRVDILMVEDNPGDARLIRTLLGRTALKPLHLTAVDRVSHAVEFLRSNFRNNGKLDVVLLDVSLPDSRHGTLDSLMRMDHLHAARHSRRQATHGAGDDRDHQRQVGATRR